MQIPSIYFKKTIAKKKIWNSVLLNILFRPPKRANLVFAHAEGKNYLLSFYTVFAFNQTKEQVLLQVQPLTLLYTKKILADFRVTGKKM